MFNASQSASGACECLQERVCQGDSYTDDVTAHLEDGWTHYTFNDQWFPVGEGPKRPQGTLRDPKGPTTPSTARGSRWVRDPEPQETLGMKSSSSGIFSTTRMTTYTGDPGLEALNDNAITLSLRVIVLACSSKREVLLKLRSSPSSF